MRQNKTRFFATDHISICPGITESSVYSFSLFASFSARDRQKRLKSKAKKKHLYHDNMNSNKYQ